MAIDVDKIMNQNSRNILYNTDLISVLFQKNVRSMIK